MRLLRPVFPSLCLVALSACGLRIVSTPDRPLNQADPPEAQVVDTDTGTTRPDPLQVTVFPTESNQLLTNPGAGMANFQFGGACDGLDPAADPSECANEVTASWPVNHPDAGTAYFRWFWSDLEPVRGEIDFETIDAAIQAANALGQTASFRIMPIRENGLGVPNWLLADPYLIDGEWVASNEGPATYWPDVRDDTLISELGRFLADLGDRYDGHPALDHVDIGTVGCRGAFSTGCLARGTTVLEVHVRDDASQHSAVFDAYIAIIDHHLQAFSTTPTVMLGIGGESPYELELFAHAIERGAGWRLDCWGDWGMFDADWSHQRDLYPAFLANAEAAIPGFNDTWMHAPVQLETCGDMTDWAQRDWSMLPPDGEVFRSFRFALDNHASVINGKLAEIPDLYTVALDDLLFEVGYRFVIDDFTYTDRVRPGVSTTWMSTWANTGVAPHYLPRTLNYRLKDELGDTVVQFESTADSTSWLPGTWRVEDTVMIPADLPLGVYQLDLAVLDRAGSAPTTPALPPLHLGIEDRIEDGWYAMAEIIID